MQESEGNGAKKSRIFWSELVAEASAGKVTDVLRAARSGDPRVADGLLPLVYDELRRLAHQQMAREIAAVVAWTLENIGDQGGDPGRVVVSGHSAGGHLVALVAMDDRYLNALGRQRAEIRGVIGISGVYDVEAEYVFSQEGAKMPHLADVFGGREGFAQASPVNLVRPLNRKLLFNTI